MRRGVLIAVLMAGCRSVGGGEIWSDVEGSRVGALNLSHQRIDDEWTYQVSLHFSGGEILEAPVPDSCELTGLGYGVGVIPLDAGQARLHLRGETIAFPADSPRSIELDRPPFEEDVGVSWDGGVDVPTARFPDAHEIPARLELVRPDPQSVNDVSAGDDLVVRWKGKSEHAILLTFAVGEEERVACWALDDGRFVVPGRFTRGARGESELRAQRVSRVWLEVSDDSYLMLSAYSLDLASMAF